MKILKLVEAIETNAEIIGASDEDSEDQKRALRRREDLWNRLREALPSVNRDTENG